MSDFYDLLEVQNSDEREKELLKSLSAQLTHARDTTVAYGELLRSFDCEGITSFEQIAAYPITRKSELIEKQQQTPPFGGLTSSSSSRPAYIFSSPGPIYELSMSRPDYWRFARALYATGFREGEVVHNCFSYHLTPAGSLADTGCHALGCTVIPAGVGQTELQVQTIHAMLVRLLF